MDKIKVKILPGGLVKIETDKVSTPAHLSADRLIKGFQELLGGDTTVEKKKEAHTHHHNHEHLTEGQ
jgi:hypothetical protein